MILPYLKKNRKFSLYDTTFDFREGDKEFRAYGDNTNKDRLGYEEFDFIHPFVEGFAIAEENNKLPCFINKEGEILRTEQKYSDLRNFKNGIAAGRSFELGIRFRFRFFNKSGKEIIDQAFDSYHFRENGLIDVRNTPIGEYSDDKDSTGLLDSTGFLIFEPQNDASYYFLSKNLIKVYGEDQHGYFDVNGNQIFDIKIKQFYDIGGFENGRSIAVLVTDEYAVIDEEFNIIKKLGKTNDLEFGENFFSSEGPWSRFFFIGGFCPIEQNGKWGYINSDGDYVLKPTYDYGGYFSDYKAWSVNSKGCTVVGKKEGATIKYGAINSNFEIIAEFVYDEMGEFAENISIVKVGEKWGAINSEGKVVVPIDFTYINYCYKGLIIVGLGDYTGDRFNSFVGKYGLYDKNGSKITKIIFDYIGDHNNSFIIVKSDGKYGLINDRGNEVVRCKYDNLSGDPYSGYLAELEGVRFYLDSNGREFRET
ncbi:MAG TPA: WG repeat-containing protein [Flavobacterium sp.]